MILEDMDQGSIFSDIADRKVASQVDDDFDKYINAIPEEESKENIEDVNPAELSKRISEEDKAIISVFEKKPGDMDHAKMQSNSVDVVKGVGKGMLTAVEETANTVIDAADFVDNFLVKNGLTDVDIIPNGSKIDIVSRLFSEPKSNAERVGKVVGQYLAPFAAVSKVVKGAGLLSNALKIGLSSTISGLITDPNDERLADLVQSVPELANPVSEFLSNEDGDSRLDRRLKNAIEAALVDTTTLGLIGGGEAVYNGLKAVRSLRKSKKLISSARLGAEDVAKGAVKGEADLIEAEGKMAQDLGEEVKVSGETPGAREANEADKNLVKYMDEKNQSHGEYKAKGEGPNGPSGGGPEAPKGSSANLPEEKINNMPELLDYLKKRGSDMSVDDMHKLSKRGVVSDEQNLRLAKRIMESDAGAVDEFFARNFGESLNQEELTLMKMGAMQKRLELENVVLGIKDPQDMDEATKALLLERVNEYRAYHASVKAGFSEAGRALRSSKKYMKEVLGGPGKETAEAASIRKQMELLTKGENPADVVAEIQRINKDGVNFYEAFDYAYNAYGKKVSDALHEVWVNSVLSGPNTLLIVNPVSNVAQMAASVGSTAAGRVYSATKLKALEMGSKVFPTWGKYYDKALKSGSMTGDTYIHTQSLLESIPEAFEYFRKSMMGNKVDLLSSVGKDKNKYQLKREQFLLGRKNAISAQNFDLTPDSYAGTVVDVFGEIINVPTKILTAQDMAFNAMHQRARLNMLSHRSALSAKLAPGSPEYADFITNFKKNPSQSTLQELERFGQEHTLTSEMGQGGSLSKAMRDLQTLMQSENIPFGAGKFAGAFMRVGTNMVDRGVQYSPFGFLRKETRDNLFSGVATRHDEEMGKMIFGTTILFGGGTLAYNGFITGSGPDDPKMRRALRSSGFQAYGIKTPGGGYIPLDTLGPMGMVLKMSADVAELVGATDHDDPDKSGAMEQLVGASGHILAHYFTPEYLTRGVPEFFGLIKEVAEGRAGTDDLTKSFARFSTGFMPYSGAIRGVGQYLDPAYRDTTPESGTGAIDKLWTRVKGEWLEMYGTAGRAGYPPELNIFGEEVTPPLGVGRSILSPIFSNLADNDDPINNELVRLNLTDSLMNVDGPDVDENLSVRMVERTKRAGIAGTSVPVKMEPWEYHDYVKLAAGLEVDGVSVMGGTTLKEAWNNLITTDTYKEASDELRKIMIKEEFSKFKSTAWKIMQSRDDISGRIMKNKERKLDKLTKPNKAFGREM